MTRSRRRVAILSLLAGGALAAGGAAQELIPAISAPGRLRLEAGFQWSTSSEFVDEEGTAQSFPGDAEFLAAMVNRGFSAQEVERMSKVNPARLLGI